MQEEVVLPEVAVPAALAATRMQGLPQPSMTPSCRAGPCLGRQGVEILSESGCLHLNVEVNTDCVGVVIRALQSDAKDSQLTGMTPSWMSRVTAASWMAVLSPGVASMTSETV